MKMVEVRAKRSASGKWWVLSGGGAVDQVKRLDQAADSIREAVAHLAGLPEAEIEIDLVVDGLPKDAAALVSEWKAARAEAETAASRAAAVSRETAKALVREGLPLRDAGYLMGVSHQRAGQLLHT
ncbi:MAG: hypothetical protein LBO20_10805 [Bifidobacteriaceae bacterium]|jgi:hypothetical protein|nr:hypothetical protein [Bifidobacteriaceae bacterium]